MLTFASTSEIFAWYDAEFNKIESDFPDFNPGNPAERAAYMKRVRSLDRQKEAYFAKFHKSAV